MYVTYSDLFAFVMVLIAVATFFSSRNDKPKKVCFRHIPALEVSVRHSFLAHHAMVLTSTVACDIIPLVRVRIFARRAFYFIGKPLLSHINSVESFL